jgi:hypothetical protein
LSQPSVSCYFGGVLERKWTHERCRRPKYNSSIYRASGSKNSENSLFVGARNRVSVFSDSTAGWVRTNEITDQISDEPRATGIDADGYLFVANYADRGSVSFYRLFDNGNYAREHGKETQLPIRLAVDPEDNLAVITYNAHRQSSVLVFPSGVADRSARSHDRHAPRSLVDDDPLTPEGGAERHGRCRACRRTTRCLRASTFAAYNAGRLLVVWDLVAAWEPVAH